MDSGRSSGPVARGRARLGREIGAKVTVWLGLAVGICVPYFGLQRVHLFPLRSVPATPLDALVAFDPAWVWAYASLALLVPLGPLLATRREELVRYAIGLAWLCAACFVVFLFFPVEGPRPATLPDDPLYRFVVSQDRPSNSLPSLHAGLTLYSFLFCWRVFGAGLAPRRRAAFVAFAGLWGAAILYATLATKQHWALDLPAGMALALGAHAWAWRESAARGARR